MLRKRSQSRRAAATPLLCIIAVAVCLMHLAKHNSNNISSSLAHYSSKLKDGYSTENTATKKTKASNNGGAPRRAHVVLVENRDLESEKSYGYHTFAMWQLYSNIRPDCDIHVYNSTSLCVKGGGGEGADKDNCTGYDGDHMAPYWMKVLGVLNAMDEANPDDLILFVDTDMHVLNENFTRSILDLDEIQTFLDSGKAMLVIDEKMDYWYNLNVGKGIYNSSIVSNLFAVINNQVGRRMVELWWKSMSRPTPWDPTAQKMRWEWPWEQERLTAYYNAQPDIFFPLVQAWKYMDWIHHGPLCCIGFRAKYDIIRTLNETLTNQTRTLSLWNGTYGDLVSDLFHQIDIRPLLGKEIGNLSYGLKDFWLGGE